MTLSFKVLDYRRSSAKHDAFIEQMNATYRAKRVEPLSEQLAEVAPISVCAPAPKGAHMFSGSILLMADAEYPVYSTYWPNKPDDSKDVLPVL